MDPIPASPMKIIIPHSLSVGTDVTAPPPEPHTPVVMVLASNVTAACAKARPFRLAPVCMLMLVPARILPTIEELGKMSAAETSLHQTLHGSPPVTDESADVVSVDADLKIQTPDPLRVRFPVSKKASAQYTPGPRGETRVRSCTPA